jgi:hypothetical protein
VNLKIELENGIRLAWPTPLFSRKFDDTEDMNHRLIEIIHEKEKKTVAMLKV